MAIVSCAELVFAVTLLMALAILFRNEFRRVPSEKLFWIGAALFLAALTGLAASAGVTTAFARVIVTISALAASTALLILLRNEWRPLPSEKVFWIGAGVFIVALTAVGLVAT